jgi:hypothetical protein
MENRSLYALNRIHFYNNDNLVDIDHFRRDVLHDLFATTGQTGRKEALEVVGIYVIDKMILTH